MIPLPRMPYAAYAMTTSARREGAGGVKAPASAVLD